jgi:DNA (cytosine-5)-methyltransferase 1
MRGDPAPSRESRLTAAGEPTESFRVYECHGQDSRTKDVGDVCTTVTAKYGTGGGNVPIVVPDVAKTLSCPKGFRLDYETETFIPTVGFSSNMSESDAMIECSPTLKLGGSSGANPPAIAVQAANTGANGKNWSEEVTQTLDTVNPPVVSNDEFRVRRLTPVECERLQGFPDGYTNVPYRHYKETPDTPRYKAIGNSFAVNVVRYIGERIAAVDKIISG